jgi:hydrogenase expression/formation protein HypC
MCLGIPGQVTHIFVHDDVRMGKLNFGGIVKEVCLEYLPQIHVGDYAIVHVGFAIAQVDEASAQETLRLFREMGALDSELSPEVHAAPIAADACPADPWAGATAPRSPWSEPR